MQTDIDLCRAAVEIYQALESPTPKTYTDVGTWDVVFLVKGVFCGIRRNSDGTATITFRGTRNLKDLLTDANCIPVWHEKLGHVHAGFIEGMDELYPQIIEWLIDNKIERFYIVGHSLGGAHAVIFCAQAILENCVRSILKLFTIGCPNPGFDNLARIVQKSGIPTTQFRNGNDPIPPVPFRIPFLLPWANVITPPTPIWEHADGEDFAPLRDHASALYLAAIQKLNPLGVIQSATG